MFQITFPPVSLANTASAVPFPLKSPPEIARSPFIPKERTCRDPDGSRTLHTIALFASRATTPIDGIEALIQLVSIKLLPTTPRVPWLVDIPVVGFELVQTSAPFD